MLMNILVVAKKQQQKTLHAHTIMKQGRNVFYILVQSPLLHQA